MIKKISIALILLAIVASIIFVYFSKSRNTEILPAPQESPQIPVDKNAISTPSWSEQEIIEATPIQTGSTIENITKNQTGIIITTTTNWPATRTMTPEEIRSFRQKIQKK